MAYKVAPVHELGTRDKHGFSFRVSYDQVLVLREGDELKVTFDHMTGVCHYAVVQGNEKRQSSPIIHKGPIEMELRHGKRQLCQGVIAQHDGGGAFRFEFHLDEDIDSPSGAFLSVLAPMKISAMVCGSRWLGSNATPREWYGESPLKSLASEYAERWQAMQEDILREFNWPALTGAAVARALSEDNASDAGKLPVPTFDSCTGTIQAPGLTTREAMERHLDIDFAGGPDRTAVVAVDAQGNVVATCANHWVNPVTGFCGRCKRGV